MEISFPALSIESLPWMTFLPMSIAKSPRMVPGADSKGVCGSNDLITSHNHTLSFPHHYHNRARNNVLNKVMSFKPFREKSFFSNLPMISPTRLRWTFATQRRRRTGRGCERRECETEEKSR
nr:hypothetical protein Iba_chr12cCG22730 [Ipomoea batatas]GMD71285.1 hypothetical protein Iba_chr12eCG14470 [Ipomoea batatas]